MRMLRFWSLTLMVLLLAMMAKSPIQAQVPDVKIALIAPLTGPWARGGNTMRQGAETAVEDINKAGGIKALNGAKIQLIVADAGDTPDKARNVTQRVLAEHPDLSGIIGAWVSSFALAATEVSERAKVPFLANAFADQITTRGYNYVFQTFIAASEMSKVITSTLTDISSSNGGKPKSAALLMENSAAAQAIAKPMIEKTLKDAGIDIAVQETFAPSLTDATSLVQRVRAAKPDVLLLFSTSIQDNKIIIEKLREYGLTSTRLPLLVLGTQSVSPDMLKLTGKDNLEGVIGMFSNWPKADRAELTERMKAKYSEQWIGQDQIAAYGDVLVLKAAIEAAKSSEPEKVAAAIRELDLRDGPAEYYSSKRVKFDPTGRMVDAGMVFVQWQGGIPTLIAPAADAAAKPIWKGKP